MFDIERAFKAYKFKHTAVHTGNPAETIASVMNSVFCLNIYNQPMMLF